MDVLQSAITRKTTRLPRGRDEHRSDTVKTGSHSSILIRNPTRSIPEHLLGFFALSKQEIKRDRRDIIKRASFMATEESDSDTDDIDNIANLATEPLCTQECALPNKRQRLISWYSRPDTMEHDLKTVQEQCDIKHKQYISLEKEELSWNQDFELFRLRLADALLNCQQVNAHTIEDTQQLFDLLMTECGISDIKKPTMAVREILDVYHTKRAALVSTIAQYEEAHKHYKALMKEKSPDTVVPDISITVNTFGVRVEKSEANDAHTPSNGEPNIAVPSEERAARRVRSNSVGSEGGSPHEAAGGGDEYLSMIYEQYAQLEEDIAERELRKHDVEPFYGDDGAEEALVSFAPIKTDSDVGSSLKDFICNVDSFASASGRSYTLDDIVKSEKLLVRCLESHSKTGSGIRKKRKTTAIQLKLSSCVYQPVSSLFPQVLSSASLAQNRNVGSRYHCAVGSGGQVEADADICDLEAMQYHRLLAEAMYLEAKINETVLSVPAHQAHSNDVYKALTKLELHHEAARSECEEERSRLASLTAADPALKIDMISVTVPVLVPEQVAETTATAEEPSPTPAKSKNGSKGGAKKPASRRSS